MKSFAGGVCRFCEKPLGVDHDDNACRRRMSRRFFFALAIAAFAARVAAKLPVQTPAFTMASADKALNIEQFLNLYMKPTVIAIAEKIEADLIASWEAFVLTGPPPVVAGRYPFRGLTKGME